ncbi:triose-phosphate isomerase family protein [Paramicrobacterium agarici]|uniref:Triosephosphate isomerase n=1 Tax=Paramicrobacterium agarici TaxID=630514 RepID=A0A2A9DW20_9MICO|nr:triose-phosphate isomerase family protein [Microbacterium agarici]PFG30192.1 triosephosphate isomerase [Microbacterium agarici]
MSASPFLIGVSLKMYFGHARTLEWCEAGADIARSHHAVSAGEAELFVVPSYQSIPAAREILDGLAAVGAQDLATDDEGAFTGEVSGAQIAELGCTLVEVGHAERRRLFGETDEIVRLKTDAALRNGLSPVLCVGETERRNAADAAAECVRQLDDALALAHERGRTGRLIVAYEPGWAIGAREPASAGDIRAVCEPLRDRVRGLTAFPDSSVIYGGSAGPGLVTEIRNTVDGLFLGRLAHDPAALGTVLDEVRKVLSGDSAPTII